MKRSELNKIIQEAIDFIKDNKFLLPPFAYWTPSEWSEKGHEYDEIRDNMLGWDATDFGKGDFSNLGLLLFTIRNGNHADPKYVKPYAEKLLISDEGQTAASTTISNCAVVKRPPSLVMADTIFVEIFLKKMSVIS